MSSDRLVLEQTGLYTMACGKISNAQAEVTLHNFFPSMTAQACQHCSLHWYLSLTDQKVHSHAICTLLGTEMTTEHA